MQRITYSGTDMTVQPGDYVKVNRWFHEVDGIVVYVPDISHPNKFFGVGEGGNVGIQTVDGLFYGIFVSEARQLKETVSFRGRGQILPALPDDFDEPNVATDFCKK